MFVKIKNDILGKDYSLSIAFVDEATSHELNQKFRKKDKATNVLSFALTPESGELVLCKEVIKREASEGKFGRNFRELVKYLVIHGMLHLKGLEHSSTMDRLEAQYDQKYFYRDRRGLRHDQNRGGRILKRRKKS